ncbi:hypothetical protein BATDEDRAFT_22852 [Batrachochytrium dendrobatidis JAM81]|uniref:Uncharacterized protein n=1 Tax=Batrachochytrium dendrobatidis (strain JAM81 / FGSC 10211) TaxID=684364 RepID=F4NVZ6_BATDJ|nr:uncharacterized protein BATDEDRAFT_22852 [Batrachochytrium dendrobatidis JAM81]EGF82742.1 hypothetical protein BATDEDRAFT_22852 [Batrachochytrium dendrobatidis JAM81]|eukprot:XP_006676651.1 hypothetical protein BATDEDRAFT_22852 [Batrachochytrium dendrobatidis JAM81]
MTIESFLMNVPSKFGPGTDPSQYPIGTVRMGQDRKLYIYIRTIPINQVILDPVNKLKYIIEEKRSNNNTLSKVASPYFGDEEPLVLEVSDESLKIANPNRFNPSVLMKNRIAELKDKVVQLNNHLSPSSKYERIKYYLGDEK